MDAVIEFLINYGYWGMFLAGLLAGSVLPFASEVVLLGLLAVGGDWVFLLLWATVGNSLGTMINYYIGSLGNIEWIHRFLHTSPERLDYGVSLVRKYGFWTGLFSWLPLIGSLFSVTLGYVRAPFLRTTCFFILGKFLRYAVLVYGFLQATQ